MKLYYSENQYEQLAKEQLCQTLNNIPFVSDVEIINSTERDSGFDFYAIVHYSDTDEVEKFCVNVKSNGEKRFVNLFMQMAPMYHKDAGYVFMAPYISEVSADSLIKNHFSFMDLSGNCYILSKRIILHYQGKENKFIAKREKKQYFSKSSAAASAIMRTPKMYLPSNNVRFIAINDNVDTADERSNEFAPFTNVFNEWYARSASKKINAVFKAKGESGQLL